MPVFALSSWRLCAVYTSVSCWEGVLTFGLWSSYPPHPPPPPPLCLYVWRCAAAELGSIHWLFSTKSLDVKTCCMAACVRLCFSPTVHIWTVGVKHPFVVPEGVLIPWRFACACAAASACACVSPPAKWVFSFVAECRCTLSEIPVENHLDWLHYAVSACKWDFQLK